MNNKQIRLKFCKGDAVAAALVILLVIMTGSGFLRMTTEGKEQMVAIYKDGEKIQEVPLGQNREFWITGEYVSHVVIKEKRVAITESDCPGEDCVHSGWISEAGRSILCLPNRVEVRIEGTGTVDFIVK